MRSSESARADSLTITRPDDGHVYLRDGTLLAAVLPHPARHFARAIIMPNLQPPVTTTKQALAYRQRILRAIPEASEYDTLMARYITDHTPPEESRHALTSGIVHAIKLLPAGATTHSDAGVTELSKCMKTF